MEYLKYRVLLRTTDNNYSYDAFGIAFYLCCGLPGYQADMKQQQDDDSYVMQPHILYSVRIVTGSNNNNNNSFSVRLRI